MDTSEAPKRGARKREGDLGIILVALAYVGLILALAALALTPVGPSHFQFEVGDHYVYSVESSDGINGTYSSNVTWTNGWNYSADVYDVWTNEGQEYMYQYTENVSYVPPRGDLIMPEMGHLIGTEKLTTPFGEKSVLHYQYLGETGNVTCDNYIGSETKVVYKSELSSDLYHETWALSDTNSQAILDGDV